MVTIANIYEYMKDKCM